MKSIEPINDFLKSTKFALVGISRNEKKFGNFVYKDLKSKGLNVVPVHKEMKSIDGDSCYPSIKSIEDVSAVISVVGKDKTIDVLKETLDSGVSKVWIQHGTETPDAITFAKSNNMDVVTGECILMFTSGDKFPHSFHRFFVKLFGGYPK